MGAASALLRLLDVYPKTPADFQVKTAQGGTLSLTVWIAIIALTLSELATFAYPTKRQNLKVDTSRGKKIHIHLNITFPNLPCAALGLVAMDVAGEQQIDVNSTVQKTRIDLQGNVLGKAHTPKPLGCGPCFAEDQVTFNQMYANRCCNTCADVRELYHLIKVNKQKSHDTLKLKWEEHPVCEHEAALLEPQLINKYHEGCNLDGTLTVNKVAGNFHFAPGLAMTNEQGQLVHEFANFEYSHYNTSHYFHSLSFGVHYPDRHNPLENLQAIVPRGSGIFRYFVKVVPTKYVYASGEILDTCQYSVTEEFRSSQDPFAGFVFPGLFVIYDVSPIEVTFEESRPSLSHFIVSLCAITGGVFTVAGLVDAVMYSMRSSHDRK